MRPGTDWPTARYQAAHHGLEITALYDLLQTGRLSVPVFSSAENLQQWIICSYRSADHCINSAPYQRAGISGEAKKEKRMQEQLCPVSSLSPIITEFTWSQGEVMEAKTRLSRSMRWRCNKQNKNHHISEGKNPTNVSMMCSENSSSWGHWPAWWVKNALPWCQ